MSEANQSRSVDLSLENFFQLQVSVSGFGDLGGKFTLCRNGNIVESSPSHRKTHYFNLDSYGSYQVIFDYFENGQRSSLKSEVLRFDGFGADPNEKISRKFALLGVSRLALVIKDILEEAVNAEIDFVSSNPKHIGKEFGGRLVQDFNNVNFREYDEWLLLNGLTSSVKRTLDSACVSYSLVTLSSASSVDEHLVQLPIGRVHEIAHDYFLRNFHVGAEFLVRYIRRRYGSVLPASVDLSGARFAYGCISTVINKNAIIGKNVTIGQNVTIGGRNGLDPKIGDGVWIGAGAVVLGAEVESNCTIGANAVVTKKLSAGSVVVAPKFRIL